MTVELTVGYLGPRGTFTDEAAHAFFPAVPDRKVHFKPYRTIPEIFIDVQEGLIDQGVAPIENSTEGSVSVTLDALVHDVDVQIVGEVILPIRHHLLARKGTQMSDIEVVLSHPQALAQCRRNVERLLPQAIPVAANSTGEAAEKVARSTRPVAALGTQLAAAIYDLEVIHSDLQDLQGNATRFIRVGRQIGVRSGRDKTSIVFGFRADKPGNLFRALKAFAEREINLTKLESRPAKRSLGDYIFFIDMDGYFSDPPVQAALAEIEAQSSFYRLLGSYPRVDYPRPNGNGI